MKSYTKLLSFIALIAICADASDISNITIIRPISGLDILVYRYENGQAGISVSNGVNKFEITNKEICDMTNQSIFWSSPWGEMTVRFMADAESKTPFKLHFKNTADIHYDVELFRKLNDSDVPIEKKHGEEDIIIESDSNNQCVIKFVWPDGLNYYGMQIEYSIERIQKQTVNTNRVGSLNEKATIPSRNIICSNETDIIINDVYDRQVWVQEGSRIKLLVHPEVAQDISVIIGFRADEGSKTPFKLHLIRTNEMSRCLNMNRILAGQQIKIENEPGPITFESDSNNQCLIKVAAASSPIDRIVPFVFSIQKLQ